MRASLFSSSLMLALLGCNGGGGSTDSDADTDVNAAAAEIAGLYRVNSQATDDGCTGNFTETLPIPFFELRGTEAGVDFYVCRSETDCDESPDSSRSLKQKKNGDWVHSDVWASLNEADPAAKYCELNERVASLNEKGGDKYTLESNKFQEGIQEAGISSESDCTDMLADWSPTGNATKSQCERIQATKVK